MAHSVDF